MSYVFKGTQVWVIGAYRCRNYQGKIRYGGDTGD